MIKLGDYVKVHIFSGVDKNLMKLVLQILCTNKITCRRTHIKNELKTMKIDFKN